MFIRYNEALDFWEYDTSVGQTGAGPWVKLPVDAAQLNNLPPPVTIPPNIAYTDAANIFIPAQQMNNELKIQHKIILNSSWLVFDRQTEPIDARKWHVVGSYPGGGFMWMYPTPDNESSAQGGGLRVYRNGDTVAGGVVGCNGLTLPGAQVADANANCLDDYEEGTWAPVLGADGAGWTGQTYTNRSGSYVKIGRMVHLDFDVGLSNAGTGAGGNATIAGIPFFHEVGTIPFGGLSHFLITAGAVGWMGLQLQPGNACIHIIYKNAVTATVDGYLTMASVGANFRVTGSITYQVPV